MQTGERFVASRRAIRSDPALANLDAKRVERDVREFRALLDSPASEEELHQFLAHHTYFFNGILRLFSPTVVYSKVKLGSQHVTDFAWFDSGSSGPEWRLVEIEGPAHAMFTKSGEPSARLHHAVQQVRDWHAWIHEHLEYARRLLLHIEYPLGYVFLGRRAEITHTNRSRLRRLAYEHRAHCHIHTLDWLADAALSVLPLLGSERARWTVPLTAMTHADLEARRPADAFEWLVQAAQADNAEDRLGSRELRWRSLTEAQE